MDNGNSFIFIWRGWFIAATLFFLPIISLFFIFEPEQRGEIWPALFMIPIIVALQGAIFAGMVILGNKLWSLTRAPK